MNDFVEQCRREWQRLRVPGQVADEMAADLAVDLREAEAEGTSAEEVLGSGAADPRSFAASWAAERGVIPPRRWTTGARRRSLALVAVAALTVVTAVGATLVVFASPDAAEPDATVRVLRPPPNVPIMVRVDPPSVRVTPDGIAVSVPTNDSGVEIHRAGSALLLVGIAGMILSLPLLFWSARARPAH